jgi:hypothetical protein
VDGVLIDVSETAREAGLRYPVAVSMAVSATVIATPKAARRMYTLATRPAMLPWSRRWSPASSGLCSPEALTLNCVLFQRNPVGGRNQALGRQHADSWAAGNSFGAYKFGNRLTIVLRHDPPCFVADQHASRDRGIRPPARRRLCDEM